MIEIPARKGKAVQRSGGTTDQGHQLPGQQVVDTWAFAANDIARVHVDGAQPRRDRAYHSRIGDTLVTNRRRPILTFVEDTSGGIHDTLFAACDRWRYEALGCPEYHDSCTDNLWAALAELGLEAAGDPGAAQFVHEHPGGRRQPRRDPPAGQHPRQLCHIACGDRLHVAFSACPQDLLPVNGLEMRPTEAHFEVLD